MTGMSITNKKHIDLRILNREATQLELRDVFVEKSLWS